MASKKQLYKLDDIGFVGTQDRTQTQVEKDAKLTGKYIKAQKEGKAIVSSKKSKKQSS